MKHHRVKEIFFLLTCHSVVPVFCSSPVGSKFTNSTWGAHHPRRETQLWYLQEEDRLNCHYYSRLNLQPSPFACSQSIGNRRNEDAYNNPTRIGQPRSLPLFLAHRAVAAVVVLMVLLRLGKWNKNETSLPPACTICLNEQATCCRHPSIYSHYDHRHHTPTTHTHTHTA